MSFVRLPGMFRGCAQDIYNLRIVMIRMMKLTSRMLGLSDPLYAFVVELPESTFVAWNFGFTRRSRVESPFGEHHSDLVHLSRDL